MILVRRAPQGVTLKNYQDFGVLNLWAEMAKLPGVQGPGAEVARATRTDDIVQSDSARPVVPGATPDGCAGALLAVRGRAHLR